MPTDMTEWEIGYKRQQQNSIVVVVDVELNSLRGIKRDLFVFPQVFLLVGVAPLHITRLLVCLWFLLRDTKRESHDAR